MKNTVKGVKRVSASEPRTDEFTKADNIRLSRAGKICLENFKKTVGTDGTVTIFIFCPVLDPDKQLLITTIQSQPVNNRKVKDKQENGQYQRF